jgi:hypothetical protein
MARGNSFEDLAKAADARMAKVRARGEQLDLLPEARPVQAEGGKPTRGPGKAQSQLREFLAHEGCLMPEQRLAEMAGLRSREDAITWAIGRAEQLLAWQFDGAVRVNAKGEEVPAAPTAKARGEAFTLFYTAAMRALDALMPYGAAKVTPDAGTTIQATQIVLPGASAGPAPTVRTVSGARRTAPPPMPGEVVEHQSVAGREEDE